MKYFFNHFLLFFLHILIWVHAKHLSRNKIFIWNSLTHDCGSVFICLRAISLRRFELNWKNINYHLSYDIFFWISNFFSARKVKRWTKKLNLFFVCQKKYVNWKISGVKGLQRLKLIYQFTNEFFNFGKVKKSYKSCLMCLMHAYLSINF